VLSTALFVFSNAQLSIKSEVVVSGIPLTLFSLPQGIGSTRTLFVFHGTDRNAQEYCEHSATLATAGGFSVKTPLFDKERFPSWRYHRGGIQDEKGQLRPRHEWTYSLVEKIIRPLERANPVYLIGHSAGGQFLNRMCAFAGTTAKRVVVANPGSVIFPRSDWKFPFGMGGLSPSLSSDDAIRAYLAQPMTFLLGSADNKPDENFDTSKEAMRQGGGRLQRSTNCFNYGKNLAQKRGWAFNWRLETVKEVGHDHQKMFDAPEARKAILEP
jgi:poly(3-hydroxybutyrate) depolymerase